MKAKFTIHRDQIAVVLERVFEAPRQLVWDTMCNPKLISEWWGPACHTTRVEVMDVRVGGRWRFVSIAADGSEYPFSGEYLEIDAPNRLVQTFNFEPIGPGHESIDTAVFEAIDAHTTRVVATSRYKSLQDLDGHVSSGMEAGAIETYERVAELIAKLRREGSNGRQIHAQ
jgi:uncharacterized protein YndB with AHSA1/START domain